MAAPREGSWGSRVESCPRMKRFRRPRRCPAGLVGGWSSEAIRLTGFCTAGDGTKRLRTHLWHAMRFTMVKHWGFYLPLGLHGRGQGSRAVLKWFKYGAHLDDASYCLPIQIEGLHIGCVENGFVPIALCTPSTAPEKLSNQVAHGVYYGKAMLYHIETSVIYMWQPFLRDSDHVNAEKDGVSNSSGSTHKDECSLPIRKLWI
ncbi:unnamed protein product [Musa hybrid cultivar]